MNYWIPQHWDSAKGRLALLGDAVHPMTFRTHISLSLLSVRFGGFALTGVGVERGQGLNHCIADVAMLIEAIDPEAPDLEEAIDKYQEEMVPRAGDEVKLSVKNTTMLVSKVLKIMLKETSETFAYYAYRI